MRIKIGMPWASCGRLAGQKETVFVVQRKEKLLLPSPQKEAIFAENAQGKIDAGKSASGKIFPFFYKQLIFLCVVENYFSWI